MENLFKALGANGYVSDITRMNQTAKRRWVKALRSGDFKQGDRKLVTTSKIAGNNKYCCLGVICEITPEVNLIDPYYAYKHSTNANYLPKDLSIDLGLKYKVERKGNYDKNQTANNPIIFIILSTGQIGPQAISLAYLNDEGFTFNQIADLIDYFL